MISAIKCKKCGDIIFSKHRHDMVWCKCNTVAIDGGQDYLRITGEPTNFELLQFVPPAEHKQDLLEIRAEIEKVLRKGDMSKAEMYVALLEFIDKKLVKF